MLVRFICFLTRWILSARYDVHVKDDSIKDSPQKGVLILPNHPAYTDPMIVYTWLYGRLFPRPLVHESYYRNPLFYPFMRLMNAVEVKDIQKSSGNVRLAIKSTIQAMVEALKSGQNVILWPSGNLQKQAHEQLGATSAVFQILRAAPDIKICLVRSKGLWGSRFSQAFLGKQPELVKQMVISLGWVVLNLLLFMPRRKVEVEVAQFSGTDFSKLNKLELNKWMEVWMNHGVDPIPMFRPYHFLDFGKTHRVPDCNLEKTAPYEDLPTEPLLSVQKLLAEYLGWDAQGRLPQPSDRLADLGMDSLQKMEFLAVLEKAFSQRAAEIPMTVRDLCAIAMGNKKKCTIQVPELWNRKNPGEEGVLGESILKAFLSRVQTDPGRLAMVDDISGVFTYRKFLLAVLVLAGALKNTNSKYVGVVMPASAGGFIAFFAVLLAGKIPVMLNWTSGPKHLEHGISILGITRVLTSGKFLDRIGLELKSAKWFFLEDIVSNVSFFSKLAALVGSRFPKWVSLRGNPHENKDQVAVVLFTSGSEREPKAVPLTHENILSNQRGGLQFLGLTRADSMISFLPPFHSFGLSVTGVMPILAGIPIVLHPDPTDAGALADKLAAFSISALIGTPTFVKNILEKSTGGGLSRLRLVITGAEKCPEQLFQLVNAMAPSAIVLEGYGITECSPVVAVNPPSAPRKGSIGLPLPDVRLKIVDVETSRVCGHDEMGVLQICGPTVFPGYLGENAPNPFVKVEDGNWYSSGDLVVQDQDGYLYFRGRLKRFIKVGGEMVSLPAIEEVFAKTFPPDECGPMVAVEAYEGEHTRRIALFTRVKIDLQHANQMLRDAGLSGVYKLDKVIILEQIPMLGTGKTNYLALKQMLNNYSAVG